MRTAAIAGVIAAASAQEKVELKTYSVDSSTYFEDNNGPDQKATQTWRQQIEDNQTFVSGSVQVTSTNGNGDMVWAQAWSKPTADSTNPPASAALRYNFYFVWDADTKKYTQMTKQMDTSKTANAGLDATTGTSLTAQCLLASTADKFLTSSDFIVSDATFTEGTNENKVTFSFKRNMRSANPALLFNEGSYLTQAYWGFSPTDGATVYGQPVATKWSNFQVLALEHGEYLKMGSAFAVTFAALYL